MSKYFLLFLATCLLAACSNNSDTKDEKATSAEEDQLRKDIAQYPDSLLLYNKLINYFADNKNYQNAINENKKLIAKDSTNSDLWDSEGRLYFLNKDTVHAIRAYEKALQISPNPEYYISLGTLYAQTGNMSALAIADTIMNKSKGQAGLQAFFIRGLYYSYSGDKEKAIASFDQCLRIDYTFLDAYREKAIALYDVKEYEEALKVLGTEQALSKTDEEIYYWQGRCLEKLGKKDEAILNYKQAIQFAPDYAEAKDALAKLGVIQ